MTSKLAAFLNAFTIGQPQTHANMTVYPLHMQNGHRRRYRTLDEAMQTQEITVTEISDGGSVPDLKVKNTSPLPVLMVVGEELIGAKQNRVLNTSVLVPAQSEITIPVSCVERGRWSYRGRGFSSSDTTAHLKLRKAQTDHVTQNLRERAKYDANQSAVWGEIDRKMSSHQSSSSTAALHDIYQQNEGQLKGYLESFALPAEAQGIMVLINGQIAGADIFDHAETMHTLWAKLLRGYALVRQLGEI